MIGPIETLWDELINYHHYGPLTEAAKPIGYSLGGKK